MFRAVIKRTVTNYSPCSQGLGQKVIALITEMKIIK